MEKEENAQTKEEETEEKSTVQVSLVSRIFNPLMLYFKCVKDWACVRMSTMNSGLPSQCFRTPLMRDLEVKEFLDG
jgi:hypothetical protein